VLKSQPDEHSLQARWFSAEELVGLSVRDPNVLQLIELAASSPTLLPVTALWSISRCAHGSGGGA